MCTGLSEISGEDSRRRLYHPPLPAGHERSLRPEDRHGQRLGGRREGSVLLAGGDQQDREVQPLHVQRGGCLLRQV